MNSSHLTLLWQAKLAQREHSGRRRHLRAPLAIDFCSNDYLGYARRLHQATSYANGATGSRLLSGQANSISALERKIADIHQAEAALIFNSGFDANLGVLAAISDRHTVFLYDEYCHASLIDGMRLSLSKHRYKFRHNDVTHLAELLVQHAGKPIAIVVESVYSMDGDVAPLHEIVRLSQQYHACLVVDEAHATGVFGMGLVQHLGLHESVDIRIHTYGKAMGCHGAAVVGSQVLIDTLINFARPFIYSTALPPASYAAIEQSYDWLLNETDAHAQLHRVIAQFKQHIAQHDWPDVTWLASDTPIQGIVIGDVAKTRHVAQTLQAAQLDVRPIFSPTIPAGTERLRICLHAFNTTDELIGLFVRLNLARKGFT
ncbi:MAG: aminotransferase class I/II-fold pyridoxal phosphate-dependent enzyme [Formosimonas sp.]